MFVVLGQMCHDVMKIYRFANWTFRCLCVFSVIHKPYYEQINRQAMQMTTVRPQTGGIKDTVNM